MKVLDRVSSVERPEIILILSNNSYYYNYDMKPCKIINYNKDEKSEELDGWSYIPIYIKGIPNYNNCVRSVIRKYLSPDEEFDLINSYNKDIITGKQSSKVIDRYLDYLKLLESIKIEVRKEFN